MIDYPHKRIYSLIGPPRAGKDTVAKYLQESRNFVAFAFADKIKEEYGINKEDFEAAKISGDIEQLRQKLWDFSASIKEKNPFYFINGLLNDTKQEKSSVIITDIRTSEELSAVTEIGAKIYFVCRSVRCLKNEYLEESTIKSQYIKSRIIPKSDEITPILNTGNSSYRFIHRLEKFFFKEDLLDLHEFGGRKCLEQYIDQFNVTEKI